MSTIKNVATITDPIIETYRSMIGHRALWMYLMLDEAKKAGLTDEFTEKAIYRCGIIHGEGTSKPADTQSLKNLMKESFKEDIGQKVFEMNIVECTDDYFAVDFNYCPLVAEWIKQGASDEEMPRLCELAMMGDRGIAEAYGCDLELPQTIAEGAPTCQIRFVRKK
jgi:hypothetical protein